ncbi:uncharacterized protein LOC117639210 [Thrips palmi]|uniref:Uncharacterized protein LOC117639210 n=1 Tax=Thrips palmi TaxID=161013 RepID=A0A6P8Y9V8_THRPL|nr:uncharacterized protein LOC117639210 [Thrips palmi]
MLVGKVLVPVHNPSEAVLVLLLSYYIFNISYHPKLHSSLEFFQRFFLQVNPPQGTKRAKKKRTTDPIDSKVKALASKLSSFSWSV